METDFEIKIRETVDQLASTEPITIDKRRKGSISDYLTSAEDAFAIVRDALGINPSADLARDFHRHTEVAVAWQAPFEGRTVAGEFRLVQFSDAIFNGPSEWPHSSAGGKEEQALFEQLRVFESQPFGGGGTETAFRLVEDPQPAEIWYYHMSQGALLLDLSYGDYLDTLLRTRGFYYWEYLFADPGKSKPGLGSVRPDLRVHLDFLAATFPDEDFADLTARLEA
jgi:hypothetical protein